MNCISFSLSFLNLSPVLDPTEETRAALPRNSLSVTLLWAQRDVMWVCKHELVRPCGCSLWGGLCLCCARSCWARAHGSCGLDFGWAWLHLPVSCPEHLLCLLRDHGSRVTSPLEMQRDRGSPAVSTKGLLELCAAFSPCFHSKVRGEAIAIGTFLFLTVLLKAWEVGTHYRTVQQGFVKDSRAPKLTHETLKELWTTCKNAAGNGNPMNGTLTIGHSLLLFSSLQYLYAYRYYCDTILKVNFGCALDATRLSKWELVILLESW